MSTGVVSTLVLDGTSSVFLALCGATVLFLIKAVTGHSYSLLNLVLAAFSCVPYYLSKELYTKESSIPSINHAIMCVFLLRFIVYVAFSSNLSKELQGNLTGSNIDMIFTVGLNTLCIFIFAMTALATEVATAIAIWLLLWFGKDQKQAEIKP